MKKSIYIFSSGEIKRKQNTIFFEGDKGKRKYIPIENTREFLIFGEVSLNKKILEFFTQNEIIIHFFNRYGYYIGSYYPREHYNSGAVILKQTEYYMDPSKRLKLASKFVKGAIQNMIKVLQYYNSRGVDLKEEIEKLNNFLNSIPAQENIDSLMAIEGNSKGIYYRSFNKIITSEGWEYGRRERRPPGDRLNALISFGNSLVYTYCLSEIYKTHLDPRIGFLHTANFRRFSLNLDVAEIFKPILSDRVIFSLVNKGMLKEKHFLRELGGLYLNDDGRKIFIEEMERKLNATISHRKLRRNVSYRTLIRMEIYKIEKHLLGEEEYEPFVARW